MPSLNNRLALHREDAVVTYPQLGKQGTKLQKSDMCKRMTGEGSQHGQNLGISWKMALHSD
jgi:hypothetical protein